MLGDPEYIQLLVNPDTHMIAVRKSVRQDYLAHHVRACYSDIRNSYELYSRELLQTLKQTNAEVIIRFQILKPMLNFCSSSSQE